MQRDRFASADLTIGQINAIVKKLGGYDGAIKFLKGELSVEPIRNWREQDGIIYFSVTSNGLTGRQWKKRFKALVYEHPEVLFSPDFKPTSGVITEIAVLKGMLFNDDRLTTRKIRAEADKRKLTEPNAEVACLIREKFSDKDLEAMNLWWIVAMHKPLEYLGSGPRLLGAHRGLIRGPVAFSENDPDAICSREGGFAFVVSHVDPRNQDTLV